MSSWIWLRRSCNSDNAERQHGTSRWTVANSECQMDDVLAWTTEFWVTQTGAKYSFLLRVVGNF